MVTIRAVSFRPPTPPRTLRKSRGYSSRYASCASPPGRRPGDERVSSTATRARVMADTLYQIIGRKRYEPLPERKPAWLKVRAPGGPNYLRLKQLMRDLRLHTVCEEAHCPNVGECWEHGTATFMILGDVCTRNCGYCAVSHGRPPSYDIEEPG